VLTINFLKLLNKRKKENEMKIDRSQLLRMAGNIACGFFHNVNPYTLSDSCEYKEVAVKESVEIAIMLLKEVDTKLTVPSPPQQ
jgi:hypothetical protein